MILVTWKVVDSADDSDKWTDPAASSIMKISSMINRRALVISLPLVFFRRLKSSILLVAMEAALPKFKSTPRSYDSQLKRTHIKDSYLMGNLGIGLTSPRKVCPVREF